MPGMRSPAINPMIPSRNFANGGSPTDSPNRSARTRKKTSNVIFTHR